MYTPSKVTIEFARDLVHQYSTFSKYNKCFDLELDDIADFDLNKFASLICLDDPAILSEATGLDNPHYEKKLSPSLINYLSYPTNKDLEIDFLNQWRESITDYTKTFMKEVLDDALADYNYDYKHASNY